MSIRLTHILVLLWILVASSASVLARQIAWSASSGEDFSQYWVSSFDAMEASAAFTVLIEEVPLGSRIATKNPEPWTVDRRVTPSDEANLRVIVAEVIRDDGTHVGIELLRSVEYINQLGLVANSRLYMELSELNVAGWVQVHSIDPCPPLCEGPGNLVTGRFVTVQAANIVRATFSDGTILTGTDIHPVWSLDKQDWVPLGELSFGEQVHSNDVPLSLVDSEVIGRPQDVYNIEVDGQHVYQVGDAGVLVHNACQSTFKLPTTYRSAGGVRGTFSDGVHRFRLDTHNLSPNELFHVHVYNRRGTEIAVIQGRGTNGIWRATHHQLPLRRPSQVSALLRTDIRRLMRSALKNLD